MFRKSKFRLGERVNGISVSGKRVFGEYRGVRASYGAYVYGLAEGCTELDTYICLVLSLERPKLEKPKRQNLKTGDTCTSITPKGLTIYGQYMNSEGKYAWIKGWPNGTNRLDNSPQAWKVLTKQLQKV